MFGADKKTFANCDGIISFQIKIYIGSLFQSEKYPLLNVVTHLMHYLGVFVAIEHI